VRQTPSSEGCVNPKEYVADVWGYRRLAYRRVPGILPPTETKDLTMDT